jgi:hypothetical protein
MAGSTREHETRVAHTSTGISQPSSLVDLPSITWDFLKILALKKGILKVVPCYCTVHLEKDVGIFFLTFREI